MWGSSQPSQVNLLSTLVSISGPNIKLLPFTDNDGNFRWQFPGQLNNKRTPGTAILNDGVIFGGNPRRGIKEEITWDGFQVSGRDIYQDIWRRFLIRVIGRLITSSARKK